MSRPAELVRRRVLPSAIIAASQVDWPARRAAAVRRALGGRARVELYLAFDDPCSAVAAVDLSRRLARRPADLVAVPVVDRGIPGDPAAGDKRRHAIADARRRGRGLGLELKRSTPLEAQSTAAPAAWVANAPACPEVLAFCLDALEHVWFGGDDAPVDLDVLRDMWREHVGRDPGDDPRAVRRNERRMRRRGPYDTPAAVVHGHWYFAHDRGPQIAERVEALGWT